MFLRKNFSNLIVRWTCWSFGVVWGPVITCDAPICVERSTGTDVKRAFHIK